MVRKQEKSDLTGLIKWNFQKVTFFFSHPLELNKENFKEEIKLKSIKTIIEIRITNSS